MQNSSFIYYINQAFILHMQINEALIYLNRVLLDDKASRRDVLYYFKVCRKYKIYYTTIIPKLATKNCVQI